MELIIPVGLVYAVIYYVVFRFMIVKFNLKTPGREPDDAAEAADYADPYADPGRLRRRQNQGAYDGHRTRGDGPDAALDPAGSVEPTGHARACLVPRAPGMPARPRL